MYVDASSYSVGVNVQVLYLLVMVKLVIPVLYGTYKCFCSTIKLVFMVICMHACMYVHQRVHIYTVHTHKVHISLSFSKIATTFT